jgi:hypothetical protein
MKGNPHGAWRHSLMLAQWASVEIEASAGVVLSLEVFTDVLPAPRRSTTRFFFDTSFRSKLINDNQISSRRICLSKHPETQAGFRLFLLPAARPPITNTTTNNAEDQ